MIHDFPSIQTLGHDIFAIDLFQGGVPGRTCSYVIRSKDKTAVIDVGSSLDLPRLLSGLSQLGIQREEVDYVIVTHIHLDHAGGTGKLLSVLPRATAVVHPRGARHLIDPSRLIAGARAVYGDRLETLFGEILPIPKERVLIREDEGTLPLDENRVLSFYHTPGHARHHFTVWDPVSQGLFTGDTVGLRYVPALTGWEHEIIYPSTSPSEFDRQAVESTISRLSRLPVKRIYHTHFGMTEPAELAFARTLQGVREFEERARKVFSPGMDWRMLANSLREYMIEDMQKQGLPLPPTWDGFELDLELNAKGLLYSLEKEATQKRNG